MCAFLLNEGVLFSKNAIVLATSGTRNIGSETYSFFEKIIYKNFPEFTIKWAFTPNKIREYKNNNCEQSLVDTLQSLQHEGFTKVFIQPLFIFPAYGYLLLLRDIKKFKDMQIYVATPLIYDDVDMMEALIALNEFYISDGLNILIAHGTKEKLGNFNNIYLNFAGYIDKTYDNVVLLTLYGEPQFSKLREKLLHINNAKKAQFIPFMFTAGHHIEEDVAKENSIIKSMVKTHIDNVSILKTSYNNNLYYMGLGFNKKIVDIFIRKLKKVIEDGNQKD
jgi:sirohydrochlorin cobaltochelatase